MKHYIDANLEGAADCLVHLEEERKQYMDMVHKREEEKRAKKSS